MANPTDLDHFVIGFCCLDFIYSFYPYENHMNIYTVLVFDYYGNIPKSQYSCGFMKKRKQIISSRIYSSVPTNL